MTRTIKIHTDGGARGNPGPAGIGFVIDGLSIGKQKVGKYIGETTNNEAEYRALIMALETLIPLLLEEEAENIECYADSELMVKQLNGEYKVKDTNLRGLFLEIQALKTQFQVPVSFHHIPRARNAEADELVNEVLDAKVGPKLGRPKFPR